MPELVVPTGLQSHPALDDDRLALHREMVGRHVYAFDGPLDESRTMATTLSEDASAPVLVNDVTETTDDTRTVDVYMHQGGREQSVSKGVTQPRPDTDE